MEVEVEDWEPPRWDHSGPALEARARLIAKRARKKREEGAGPYRFPDAPPPAREFPPDPRMKDP